MQLKATHIGPPTSIRDIQPQNRVKSITKLTDGGLRVEQHSGNVFVLSPDDELFQAFVVYSVVNEL